MIDYKTEDQQEPKCWQDSHGQHTRCDNSAWGLESEQTTSQPHVP